MKIKTPARINDSSRQTSHDVLSHVQAMTDDLRTIMNGGLSFSDGQLPFQVQKIFVTNNVTFNISMNAPFTIVGCVPIQTYGINILSFKTRLENNRTLNVTITLDVPSSNIDILMIGV